MWPDFRSFLRQALCLRLARRRAVFRFRLGFFFVFAIGVVYASATRLSIANGGVEGARDAPEAAGHRGRTERDARAGACP